MSFPTPPPREHVTLLDRISRSLRGDDIPRFKHRCLAEGLRQGEVERHSVLELLEKLDRRRVIAPGVYTNLCHILTDIDRGDLVRDMILHEDPRPHDSSNLPSTRDRNVIDKVVTEEHLSKLASWMGKEWQQFGIQYLEMTECVIDKFKRNNYQNIDDTIRSMLVAWKEQNGVKATYGALISKLKKSSDIDQEVVHKFKEMVGVTQVDVYY